MPAPRTDGVRPFRRARARSPLPALGAGKDIAAVIEGPMQGKTVVMTGTTSGIGEVAAVDQDAFRFCFEAMTRDTDLESLELEIEFCPRRHRCTVCAQEFVVRDYDVRCPQCASFATACISGDELELAYLEVEEYGTSLAGTKSTQ